MMMEPGQAYASIILRLLLDEVIEPVEQRTILWGDLLHVAAQNGVLIRVVDKLEQMGLQPRHFFSASVREMRARNQRKLGLIGRIGEGCVEGDVEFIFPKVFQNYPDMSGDIDLYISPRSPKVDAVVLRGLGAVPVKRNLRNRIDGTANYRLPGCDSLLEIHHGRVGMLGEHKSYIKQIIENGRFVRLEGWEFLVPSPEDQLILQALQRVVQRSYLRLSDVVSTIILLRRDVLDWDYILKTVKDLNIFYGLGCYLSFVEQIYSETFKSLLPPDLMRSVISKRRGTIEFREGFYRFHRIRVGSRGYANKFCSAVITENWAVASRLSLLPVLALTTISRKALLGAPR
jgi:putative nucleotidyltransferase-like protein